MRRARDTAALLGAPVAVDARIREVPRPWAGDFADACRRYLLGEALPGWEPQRAARTRFAAAVAEHGDAVYVTHGTVLAPYLASVVPALDAVRFWTELSFPGAWALTADGTLTHLP
jgi:hypothetical protein